MKRTKLILFVALMAPSLFSLGQIVYGGNISASENLEKKPITVFREFKTEPGVVKNTTPCYINNIIISNDNVPVFDPSLIKDLKVNNIEKPESNLKRGIFITLLDSANTNFTSLETLDKKYNLSNGLPTIYMLNKDFLKGNLSDFKIDENYILSFKVLTSDNLESFKNGGQKFSIVKILTKIEENKTILRIRGNNEISEK